MEPVPSNKSLAASQCQHHLEATSCVRTTTACSEHTERASLKGSACFAWEEHETVLFSRSGAASADQDQSVLLDSLRELCLLLLSETIPPASARATASESDLGLPMTTWKEIWRMLTTSPTRDRLQWSAICYHVGAQIFIVNTLLAWLAYAYPETELPGQIKYGVGLTTLPANICFLGGAYLEFVDTVNKLEHIDCPAKSAFGYGATHSRPDNFGGDKRFVKQGAQIDVQTSVQPQEQSMHAANIRRHRWILCSQSLKSHSAYDSAVTACIIQLVGATVYIMTGMADLPGISSALTPSQKIWLYWTPNIVASGCFVGASVMFILETQEKWYKPFPHSAVWWATAWAFVGSLGFLLNGILGPVSYMNWNAGNHCLLANFWGSVAFLFSSACQIYASAESKKVFNALPNS